MFLLVKRVEDVGVDAGNHNRDGAFAEDSVHATAPASDVVTVERVGEDHVASGVEPSSELRGLRIQVTFNGKSLVTGSVGAVWVFVVLRVGAEPLVELEFAAIS